MFQRALRAAAVPALIALFVTLARFFSERAELPSAVSFLIGIFWLTLALGVYWGFRFASEDRPYRLLFASLLVFAVLSRVPVVLMWWVTKTYGLGTHYDVFRSWGEALQAQLLIGVAIQLVTGGLLGTIVMAVHRRRPPVI